MLILIVNFNGIVNIWRLINSNDHCWWLFLMTVRNNHQEWTFKIIIKNEITMNIRNKN